MLLPSSRKPDHEITKEINYIEIQVMMVSFICQPDRAPDVQIFGQS